MNKLTERNETIQQWGSGLGLHIPAAIATELNLVAGSHVTLEVINGSILLRADLSPKPTLEERLKAFDPAKHGGEYLAFPPVGKEVG